MLLVIHLSEFIGFTCAGIMVYYGRSRIEVITENCADILRVLSYKLSSAGNNFIVFKEAK